MPCPRWSWGRACRPRTSLGLALVAGLGLILAAAPAQAAEASFDPRTMGLVWTVPFIGLLLSIAVMPILVPSFWHHNFGKVSFAWGAAFILPFAMAYGIGPAFYEFLHIILADYVPFIVLLLALYTVGGGVLLRGSLVGNPATNTALLAIGTAIAGWMGTTGASMLLIRPVIRANAWRKRKTHTFVFFIFLVSNIGGALTPLGDPPLYMGFLKGVDFFWPLQNLIVKTVFMSVILLAVYFVFDTIMLRREVGEPPAGEREPLSLDGLVNIPLLAAVVAVVLVQGAWDAGEIKILGVAVGLDVILACGVLLVITWLSMRLTPQPVREANGFGWGAMEEVAQLFAGIFVAMIPVLAILRAGREGAAAALVALTSSADGAPVPAMYFWLTGVLSSFLDNAPTYLVFFNLAGGDPQQLMGPLNATLTAISAGAVFMGANSYIGNAPNLMVRAIVEEQGVKMPSFFGYCGWALVFLVPLFALMTPIFFR
ncbi:MAG: sodium:proton antiporter [Alphaproteobacteria bacterium]|nr:sodium:proton antiporter [Alphaproteobacteria bacterium]